MEGIPLRKKLSLTFGPEYYISGFKFCFYLSKCDVTSTVSLRLGFCFCKLKVIHTRKIVKIKYEYM